MKQLGVFAKFWQAGAVKTRLAASLGHATASRLHRAFVACLVRRLEGVPADCVLVCSPAVHQADFRALAGPAWRVEPQVQGDLGRRMQQFFHRALACGAQQVVLVGSDSPTLPAEFVEEAFRQLHRRRIVLGPAEDGGYYLVGVSGQVPDIFSAMAWGSNRVWDDTVRRLDAAGCAYHPLPAWYDVDTRADLERLARELEACHDSADPRSALRRQVEAALAASPTAG